MPGLSTEDEINERVYQENKDRPLAEVPGFLANHTPEGLAADA
jgi:hypothetical protein